jgi:hypothetical protein
MAAFVLKALAGPMYVPPAATGIFTDVPQADSFAPWIEELYNRGVVAGCGPGPAYCPNNSVNRQQMSVFAAWIEELYDRGIAAGCGMGNYCPLNPTTRGQMAPFLSKTFGRPLYGP